MNSNWRRNLKKIHRFCFCCCCCCCCCYCCCCCCCYCCCCCCCCCCTRWLEPRSVPRPRVKNKTKQSKTNQTKEKKKKTDVGHLHRLEDRNGRTEAARPPRNGPLRPAAVGRPRPIKSQLMPLRPDPVGQLPSGTRSNRLHVRSKAAIISTKQ